MVERFEKNDRMSQVVVHNGVVYLSGQVAEGRGGVRTQTTEILGKIDRLLESVGSDKSKILTATVYLRSEGEHPNMIPSDFEEMNYAWKEWVDRQNPPARTTVKVLLVDEKYKVEITVVAAI